MAGCNSRKLDFRGKLLLAAAGWMVIAAPATLSQVVAPPKAPTPAANDGPAAQSPSVPQSEIAAGGKMAFDVASIRPSTGTFTPPVFPLDNSDAYRPTGGRFKADFPLLVYIQFAYKLRFDPEQMRSMLANLPKWVANTRFAIEARVEGNPTKDQMRLMMQSLLADRFQLAVHFETKEAPVLFLTLIKPGKMGSKLRLHADGPPCDPQAALPERGPPAGGAGIFPPICDATMLNRQNGVSKLGSRNNTMAMLAEALSIGRLGRPVVDKTGLNDRVDYTIEWTPESDGPPPADSNTPPDSPGPTFLQALHEQLGLKLEPARAPIQVLVIDHVERPSEN